MPVPLISSPWTAAVTSSVGPESNARITRSGMACSSPVNVALTGRRKSTTSPEAMACPAM